jgi:hypothetical protein
VEVGAEVKAAVEARVLRVHYTGIFTLSHRSLVLTGKGCSHARLRRYGVAGQGPVTEKKNGNIWLRWDHEKGVLSAPPIRVQE